MPPEPPQMTRMQRLQMNWALKPAAQREKLRAKYNLKPSKLGGKLAEVRKKRLENAGPMRRMRWIGRSVKYDAKRTGRHAIRDSKNGIKRAANQISTGFTKTKKNIKDTIARTKHKIFNRGQQASIQQLSIQPKPRLPEHHPPQRTIPNIKDLDTMKAMWEKDASEINAKFENGKLSFTSSKWSLGALRSYFSKSKKDETTRKENADSITAVLQYIEEQTSPEVRELVMNSYIQLDGDKKELDKDGNEIKMTVKDRIDRGTFLSSKFIEQLHAATIHAQKAVMTAHNQQAVDHFLSNQPSTALDELDPRYSEVFKKPDLNNRPPEKGCQQSGLSRWLNDVISKGGFPGKPVDKFPDL